MHAWQKVEHWKIQSLGCTQLKLSVLFWSPSVASAEEAYMINYVQNAKKHLDQETSY